MSSDAHAKALAALTRFQVADNRTVGDTLDRIVDISLEAIPAAALAGISMLGEDDRPTTAVYTAEEAPAIDAAQYAEDRGPCLDAWRDRRVVRLARVEDHSGSYPGFVAACAGRGVRSTLSLPMVAGESTIGSLNLYARVSDGFGEDHERLGLDLARAAASVLANASAYWTAFEVGQQLEKAMETRAVIEQAKGILMARSPELDADEAFEILRRASQRENVKLRMIAQRIVDRRPPSGSCVT